VPIPSSIAQLRDALNGRVITPDDTGYDGARAVYYRGFDRRPAAIVRAGDETDVAHVVGLARETGAELAVRGGGHSMAGHGVSEGGIVLDLGGMRALDIDVERRTAWAQTGLTAGGYTAAAGAHGLATGFGDAGSVGIGGITLGGGVGFLARRHGLTIDDLLAAEVVTADGRLLHVDAETHPDLFWALRGGGGNFGVATRLQFRLHEIDTILGGMLVLPARPDVVSAFVAEAEAAPDDLSTIANVMTAPPMPFLPEEHHGRPVMMVMLVHAGATDAGERVIARLRALATPIVDMIRPSRYAEVYEAGDPPSPAAMDVHTMFMDAVDRGAAQAITEQLQTSTAAMAAVQIRVLGGAVARVPDNATAFAHRGRRVMVNVAAAYERPEEAPVHRDWVAGLAKELQQGDAGAYVNFLGDTDEARIRDAYPGATWDRLTAIKGRYDPSNVFRVNHNIPPVSDGRHS
jgi:FAD/FMN-containing dehydrogenase